MQKDEFYFFQDYKQCFIRISHVDVNPTWEGELWVHFYESVILEDLFKYDSLKESYRKFKHMDAILNNVSIVSNLVDIKVLHKIPNEIVEKVRTNCYDNEVYNFPYFSVNGKKIYSSPISTKKQYRRYIVSNLLL
jgi:hypothetical protein